MEHLNLSLTLNENGSVTAVWTPVSGADRYHVALRGLYDDFLLEREDNLTATSFTSREGLEANRQYVVRVQAYSGSAHLVTESKQILVDSDFYNKTPLSVPGNVTAEATSTTVTVRFDAVDRATRYDILLGDREEEVTGTSKSFYNLEPKTTYLYRVRAKNNSKTGAYSPVQYITTRPEPPAQPRNIKGSATENTVTVSWEAVGRAAGYELLFNGASYKTKNTVYTVSGLEKGTGYSYKVRAYTAEAEGAWSRESTITTIPGIPSNITAEATANSVLVRWDEVKGATFYKRRFGDLDGNEVIVPGRDSKITGLTPGTTYHYQICAFNNSGEGRYSPVKSITTLRQTLGTPVIRLKKNTDNSATVGWAAVMGATEYEVSCNGSVRSTTDTAMTIPDLKAATDYSIRVRAKSTAGGSFYSEPVTVTTAPKPPVGIRAESTDTKVTISWEAAEGATGYLVRFNQTDIPAAGTTATFSNLTADTAYSYQVCAKGIHGNGSFSREQTVRTLAAAPEVPEGPAAPTNIRKSVSGNTAAFSWNPVSGATGYTIKFNNAQYQQASVSREFTGLEAGTDYSFQVRAENAAGSGAWSASVTAAVPPAPPVNIRAVSTKDSVTISWDAVPKAAGYQVRWGTGTVDTIASSYTFQGLQADEEYTYQVCCKSRDGIGSYSGEQRIRTKEVQLSVPVILTKTATDTSVQVSWGAVAGAACYDVRLMTSTGIVDSGRVTANTITFTGLRADLPYSVQVCARNGNSTSADSSAVTVRTAPTPPSDIRTSAGVDCIYISWTAVRGAKGYILQCGQKEEMTDADTTKFTFTDLTPDTEYSCKICCRGADGDGSYSLPQLVSTSKNPQGAPDVPAGVRAAAFGNSVTVSWNAVAGADSYFLIFNGEIIRVSGTSYTVSSLSPGTTYPYQVCSVKGEKQSAYTVKKVTTAPAAPGNITAEYSAAQAVIRWEAVPDAAAYRVCCGTEERLVQGGTLSCIFSGLRPGTQYVYKVCSINKHGTGSYSRERSFSTPETAPDIPVILRKTVSGRKAEIVWETVEKASYYNIRLVSDTGKEYIDMRAGRTWSAELAEGHSYSAQVRACGRTGCSAYSAAVSMVMPPAPPSGIAAEGTEHSITVSWSPAEDAAGYVVRCGSQEKTAGADMTAVSFTGLVSGTEYSYQICAVSADGRGVFSGKQTFSTPRSQEGVLPAPTNVGFQVSQEFLSISWDWVKGATGYQVLLNSSTYTIPADENEIVLIIKPNKEYSIRVRAVNRLIGGDYSTKLDITSPPASPRGLTLETSETDVTVSWEAVENATGYTVLMNNVRYPVDSGETTSITIPLEPGTQFDCKVMSRNLFGESVYPANGSGWTTLRPPVGIRAVADDASVTISWEEVAGATGYEVSLGDQIHMVEGGRTSFIAADLAPGAYTYTVRTRNRGGLGSPSEAGRIGFRMPPPGVPEHVYAMVLSHTVKIEWSSVEGALGYHVLFDGDNYETPLPCKVFTGLAPNTYYSYAVRAYNEGGPGEYSPAQEARTLPTLPEAPGDVRAFPASAHSIEISWSPVTAADSYQVRVGDKVYEASDSPFVAENLEQNTVYTYAVRSGNSMGFSNYSKEGSVRTMLAAPGNIRASAGETSVTLRWDPVPGAEAYEVKLGKRNHETTETELEIPGLSENTLYTYTLRVKNGMEYGEYSPKGHIKTLFSLAHRSLNVTAEAASGSVLVSWDDVNEAEHYELEFDGIVIQRKGANSPYAAGAASEAAAPMVRSLAAEAGKTGQARIYHTIAGLKPNTTHKYRVRAGNAGGYGPYSALQSISTCISQRRGLPDMAQDRVYPDGRPAHLGLDPVNPLTGSFLWSHTCLEDSGKDRLHFTLLYDSQRGDDGKLLGRGWSHALHYQLSMDEAYAYFHTPRGEVIPFGRDGEGGGFHPVEETAFGYTMAAGGEGAFEVTDPDGMVYVFGSSLILCEMRQWGETIFRFRADEGGRIKEIRGRYGAALLLAYEGDCIAAVSNTAGERLSLLYQEGSLTMLRLPGDSSVSFGYDGAGRLAQLKDALGKVWLTNEYDGPGRVIRQHAAGRGASTASYDTENRTTAFTDPSGNTTLYRYDEKGCITEVWLEGSSIRRSYNERGQVTEETDALGSVTQMGYDGKGRMNRLTHPDGSTETVTYNERNQPAEVVGRDGTRTLYGYDEKGRLASIRDGRGNVCAYGYDEGGRLVSYTDREGQTWTYAYDSLGHLSEARDPAGSACHYSHDALGRLESYTSPEGRTTRWTHGSGGRLLSVSDPAGTISFTYDGNGSLIGETDRRGSSRRLAYNGMGQLALATDCLGKAYTYAYDGAGRLAEERDPLGYSLRYAYDGQGRLTSRTDKNGGATAYIYDAAGRLIQARDAAGGTWNYAYDSMGQTTGMTDPLGQQTAYAYDGAGRLIQVTDALGQSRHYAYDPAGNLILETDEEGTETAYTYDKENRLLTETRAGKTFRYTYDSLGRLTAVEDPEGFTERADYDRDGSPLLCTNQEGSATEYAYDGTGRVQQITAADGSRTSFTYDANGNCTSVTDGEGHTCTYEYDANNRLVRVVDPLSQETAYAYNDRGDLSELTDAMGGVHAYEYDGNGSLVRETDPLGGVRTYAYDSLNRLVESRDEEGYVQSYAYDSVGNLVSHTDANGNSRSYTYDALGRLAEERDGAGGCLSYGHTPAGRLASVRDQEGAVTSYEYDALGYLVKVTDGLGNSVSFTRDSLGRVLTETDGEGNTRRYAYTPAGHLRQVTDPEGNATTYTHDPLGRVLTETDANGSRKSYAYDRLGRVAAVTDALGGETAFSYRADGRIASVRDAGGGVAYYGYDACGNLSSVTNAEGYTIRYEYDAMNRRVREYGSQTGAEECITLYAYDKRGCLLREINPIGGERHYAYDGNGNRVSIVDEEGQATRVTYDLNNLPLSLAYSDGRQAAFRYNKRGQLVEMEDWTGKTSITRDLLGRAVSVRDSRGFQVGYGYDRAGRRSSLTYPDGSRASYAYDGCGRLSRVTDGEGESALYGYDRVGNLQLLMMPGLNCVFTHNGNGQPERAEYWLGDGRHILEGFSYDSLGRVLRVKRTGESPVPERETAYEYDAMGRLTSWEMDGRVESYTYDRLGNRLTKRVEGVLAASYEYDAMNRLISAREGESTTRFTYDRRGNLTEESRGTSRRCAYTYDTAGRMVTGREEVSGEESRYRYNALGMRLDHWLTRQGGSGGPDNWGGRTLHKEYVPDWLSPTAEDLYSDQQGRCRTRALYGRGYACLSLKVSELGSLQGAVPDKGWFGPDRLGSPLVAAHSSGRLLGTGERDPWGELEDPGRAWDYIPGMEEAMGFTSYQYDPVVRKHFAKARFYDGERGRMVSRDPVKEGLNPYLYCGDDPVNRTDPTGEISILAGGLAGGLLGGGAGFVGSLISQVGSGEKFSLREALGSAAEGAVTGAVKGALLSTGVGLVPSLGAEFLGGAAGSALGQWIRGGKADLGESLVDGLGNALSGWAYGSGPIKSLGNAVFRGARAGAVYALIHHEPEKPGLGTGSWGLEGYPLKEGAAPVFSPYIKDRDIRTRCMVPGAWAGSLGCQKAEGYQYGTGQAGSRSRSNGFGRLFKEVALGALLGGLSSAAFYGAGKALEVLKRSVGGESGSNPKNVFPKNPDDLLPEIPRNKVTKVNGTTSQTIQTSDNIRIRAEQHPLLPGETYNPRHHGVHYHVEYKVDPTKSWNNKNNVKKWYPEGYTPGAGSGFIPGETFPE